MNKFEAWCLEHRDLIGWLMTQERQMPYGSIEIYFHSGKIDHYDIRPRERRKTLEQMEKLLDKC